MRCAAAVAQRTCAPQHFAAPWWCAALVLLLACTACAEPSLDVTFSTCTCPRVEDLSPPPKRTTNITVCAIFRDEARDLFEWVMYH
jgi:hypothetical protein